MLKRSFFATILFIALLAGCSQDVRTARLASYDLGDRDVVNEILGQLSSKERGPFLTYTIHHLATSKAFCGDVLVDENGREPATIGEAIRMTVERDKELKRLPDVVDTATLTPMVRYRLRLEELESHRSSLIDDREMLLMTGEDAQDSPEYKTLQKQITATTAKIAAHRKTAPAGTDSP